MSIEAAWLCRRHAGGHTKFACRAPCSGTIQHLNAPRALSMATVTPDHGGRHRIWSMPTAISGGHTQLMKRGRSCGLYSMPASINKVLCRPALSLGIHRPSAFCPDSLRAPLAANLNADRHKHLAFKYADRNQFVRRRPDTCRRAQTAGAAARP